MSIRPLALAAAFAAAAILPAAAQHAHRHDLSRGARPDENLPGYDTTTVGTFATPPGGSPGNAAFNNQIRKHTAPLTANGK